MRISDLIKRLRQHYSDINGSCECLPWADLKEAADQLEAQAKELEALRKDAERYRFMRNTDTLGYGFCLLVPVKVGMEVGLVDDLEMLDAAIDAAIGQSVERK